MDLQIWKDKLSYGFQRHRCYFIVGELNPEDQIRLAKWCASDRVDPHAISPNVTWTRLTPKSNAFFRGPSAAFPSNFVNIGWVVFANEQTNWLIDAEQGRIQSVGLTVFQNVKIQTWYGTHAIDLEVADVKLT